MDDTVGTLFLRDKQVRLITALADSSKEWHIADLAKVANVTYVHTSMFVKKCESRGIIVSERHGRTKKLKLTEKGVQIAKNIASIIDGVSEEKEKPAQQPQK